MIFNLSSIFVLKTFAKITALILYSEVRGEVYANRGFIAGDNVPNFHTVFYLAFIDRICAIFGSEIIFHAPFGRVYEICTAHDGSLGESRS